MERKKLLFVIPFLALGALVYCANTKWHVADSGTRNTGIVVSKDDTKTTRKPKYAARKEVPNKEIEKDSGAVDQSLLSSFLNLVSLSNSSQISEFELRNWLVDEGFEFTESSSGMTETGTRILFDSKRPNRGVLNFRAQAAGNDEASLKLEGIWFSVSANENSFTSVSKLLSTSLRSDLWTPLDPGGRQGISIWRSDWNADITLSFHDKERPTRWENDSETLQLAIQPGSGHY